MAHSNSQPRTLDMSPAAWTRVGLTHPAVIDAYVNRRVSDASLLSVSSDVRYGDFFIDPS